MLFVKLVLLGVSATLVTGNRKATPALRQMAAMAKSRHDHEKEEYKNLADSVCSSREYRDFIQQSAAGVDSNPHTLLGQVNAAAPAILQAVASGDAAPESGPNPNSNLRVALAAGPGESDSLLSGNPAVCKPRDQKAVLLFIASNVATLTELYVTLDSAKNDYTAGNYNEAIDILTYQVSPILIQLSNAALAHVPGTGTVGQWRDALLKVNNLVLQYIQNPQGPDSWVGFKQQITGLLTELLAFPKMLNTQLGTPGQAPTADMTTQELRAMAIQEGISVGCTCGYNLFSYIMNRGSRNAATTTTTTIAPVAGEVVAPAVTSAVTQAVQLALFIENTVKSLDNLVQDIRQCKKDKDAWENLEYRILIQILQLINQAAQNREFEAVYNILKKNSGNLSTYLINIAEGTSVDQMEAGVLSFIGNMQAQLTNACPAV